MESDPIETEKQDSTTQEPILMDAETCSSSVMGSPKKQVKKKKKKPLARVQKCNGGSSSTSANHVSKATKTKKPENANPKILLLDDSSASDKKAQRNVPDEDLEEALNKLQENKMRRWAMIRQKFYEKYEKVSENSKECGGNGHRNYESLGQEANLVYVSEDLAEYHNEANNLRDFIEGKILTLKPYQAKLKSKKKAQENKECSEKTMEKIVKATLQFQKKCSLNGDPILSNIIPKSPTSSVEKDKSVAMETVPSPSKSPEANHRTSNGITSSLSSPSPMKAVVKPNSPNLQKSQKALKSTIVQTVSNYSKSPGDKMSEEQSSASFSDKSDSAANLSSEASVSVQDKNSTKGKSRSEPFSLNNRTVLKFQKRQSIKSSKTIIDSGEVAELDSESVIDESSPNDNVDSFSPASNEIQSISIDELPFKNLSLKNQTVQKIKELPSEKNSRPSTSSFSDKHKMEKFSSGSVEMTASDALSDFTSTSIENSSKVRSSAVKKRKYKRSKEDQIASESVEMTASDHLLDSTAVRSGFKETPSSALKKQKGKDSRIKSLPFKQTIRLSNPSHISSLQTPKRDNSSDAKFFNFRDEKNVDILTSPNPTISPGKTLSFRKRFQKRQSIKSSKTISNSEEMAELDSESVIDESSPNDDLNSFSPASYKIQTVSVDQLPFKQLSLKNQTVQSKEVCQSDLDLFAVSGSSECENESGSDKRTVLGFHNPSPTKHQSFRGSSKIKELHPQRHSGPSPSSFCDKHDKDQLSSGSVEMTASDPLSDFSLTSVENSSKFISSAVKKRKYKPSEDQIVHKSVDMTASDHLLVSTPIGSDFKESPSALKKRKCKDLRKENLPLMRTIRLSHSISPVPSFRKRFHHHSHKSSILCTIPVDELVRPPPEQDL